MTAVDDACAALRDALPLAEALIAEPDADGATIRGKPSSRPPWNAAAANALLDAVEAARRLEAALRCEVTGRVAERRPASAAGAILRAIPVLAGAADPYTQRETAIIIVRVTRPIMQLAAIDQEERAQTAAWPCPYCGFEMVRLYPLAGRVTCLRYGLCYDANGVHPVGLADWSRLDGTAAVYWSDGLVT